MLRAFARRTNSAKKIFRESSRRTKSDGVPEMFLIQYIFYTLLNPSAELAYRIRDWDYVY
jgi:hypothetical protein